MKAEIFHSVCPLEIGDTVAVRAARNEDGITVALYMPENAAVIVAGPMNMKKVTDILTLHFLKTGETQFMYELDGSGKYEPLEVQMPVRMYEAELRKQESRRK